MNVFELLMWSLVLWLVCWLTIMIAQWSELHLGLVSFLMVGGGCTVLGFVPRKFKGDAK